MTDKLTALELAERALWTAMEHNALHHGADHNTVDACRKAHEAVKAEIRRLAAIEAEAYERGRQAGMAQEHALWKLAQSGQEIEATTQPPGDAREAPHLFELWWAEYMPEATQARAWQAWVAAPRSDGVGVVASERDLANVAFQASQNVMDRIAALEAENARLQAATAQASEPSALTGCNCRWNGDEVVARCELHEAWHDTIHEWAERAKTAEAKPCPDRYADEINHLRNVIQAACIGGTDAMVERWKQLFPDAPVPTVAAPARAVEPLTISATDLAEQWGEVTTKRRLDNGEPYRAVTFSVERLQNGLNHMLQNLSGITTTPAAQAEKGGAHE